MKISHIFFDFGGVVIDHKVPQAIPAIISTIAERYWVTYNEVHTFRKVYIESDYLAGTMTFEEVIAKHEEYFGKPLPEDRYKLLVEPMWNALFYQEIEEYIYNIKNQWYTVCLLSDMTHERKKIFIDKWWYKSFDIQFHSCDLGFSKAKDNRDNTTDIYKYVLKDLWISWENCLFIDDKESNCKQANKIWIRTIQAMNPVQIIENVNLFLWEKKK